MNVDLLEALVAVADEGGYARAGRLLNLSQPAVYQRIQRLEATTGAPVVVREGRRIRLTPAGEVIYTHARDIIRQLRLLEDALREDESPGAGVLALMVAHSLCGFPAPDICLGFQRKHTEAVVDLRISARPARDIDREIRERRSDLGMHSDPTPVKGLVKNAFYEEECVAVAWPGHRFEDLEVISPQDFADEEVVMMRDATYTFSEGLTEAWFTQGGVQVRPRLISNSFLGVRSFVERRAGVAIMPREHAVQSPYLIIRRIVNPPVRRLYFVSRVSPYESPVLRAFRDYVLSGEWLRKLPAPFNSLVA
ncbi:MAG: LysR family transcriptional regulator [Dehalococcoidia bacterium]|nr:LysR family transcriptional regulator [Dehalococcoidia bacterium]